MDGGRAASRKVLGRGAGERERARSEGRESEKALGKGAGKRECVRRRGGRARKR